jgi:hypothetical protein
MAPHDDLTIEERLARLADASLPEPERESLLRAVADSPELAARLAEQERAVRLVRGIDVAAPAGLAAAVAARSAPRAKRRRWQLTAPSAVAVTAGLLAVIFALALPGGSPDVLSAAHLALSRATLPAPARSAVHSATLTTAVDGVAFPDWEGRGWRVTGARVDSLGGHTVKTVFYASAEYADVGYSIAAGSPLAVGPATRTVVDYGVNFELLRGDGATIVTWLRDGHTCVLASRRAGASVLLTLASAASPASTA